MSSAYDEFHDSAIINILKTRTTPMPAFKEYGDYDAVGLAELIKQGDVSSADCLDSAIERCEAVNPQINAVVHQMLSKAQQQLSIVNPEAPFAGVPFLLKDLMMEYGGEPLTMGSCFFKDFKPARDSVLVERFKRSGLVIFGKTNTPEFGVTPITDPDLHGSARNPWNLERTPGGSSGGSGAAVAAGIVPMASGGDGGGSIRIPASCCGLVGLKPSNGRNPSGPDRGETWFGMAVEHALTRSVRDSAALLDATAGGDIGPPHFIAPPNIPFATLAERDPKQPLRIAVSVESLLGRGNHPDCVQATQETAALLAELGHHIDYARPEIDREEFILNMVILIGADTSALIRWGEVAMQKRARRQDFEPETWALKQLGDAFSAHHVATAHNYIHKLGRVMGEFMQTYDVLLTPTMAMPAPEIGYLKPKGMQRLMVEAVNRLPLSKLSTNPSIAVEAASATYDYMSETPLANATGQPSISLPMHWNDAGLPVGVMLTGRFADEATLFQLAGQLERTKPWNDHRPSI